MSGELTRAPVDGLTFSNGYHSAGLAEMLEVIMQHQDHFVDSAHCRPTGAWISVVLRNVRSEELLEGSPTDARSTASLVTIP